MRSTGAGREFEEVARAIRRSGRRDWTRIEEAARRARTGDERALRKAVEGALPIAVAVARRHRDLAPAMEVFEAATSALFPAVESWRGGDGTLRRHLVTATLDAVQPLLDEVTRARLLRVAAALHGRPPQPHAAAPAARQR